MGISGIFFAISALALVAAACVIGSYPNSNWGNPDAWITAGFLSLVGLFSAGIGMIVAKPSQHTLE